MSEQFLNTYLKLAATAQLFHHESTGHWQLPITHVTHAKMVTHLTDNLRPTDPFQYLLGMHLCSVYNRRSANALDNVVDYDDDELSMAFC